MRQVRAPISLFRMASIAVRVRDVFAERSLRGGTIDPARERADSFKVYISGALMASNDLSAARGRYEACADMIRGAGFVAYVPHEHTDPEQMGKLSAGS